MPKQYTYDSTVRVEDVRDLIANVAIRKTPFISNIGVAPNATDTAHSWLQDTLENSGDNAQVEGADPTYTKPVDPTKASNVTQILEEPFRISWSQLNVKHHGFADPWSYHKVKETIALKKDLEHAALFGTLASGTGSAARRMNGLIAFISTYKDGSSFSGKLLSASIFNELARNVWINSEILGGVALVGSFQKSRISQNFASFDSANRRDIVIGNRTLSIPIDTIITDYGDYEIQLSHEMNTEVPDAVVGYQPDFHKIAYLINSEPQAVEFAPTGKARQGMIWTQGTLEVHEEKTNGMVLNLATS